jgi:calcineurin-like phosphoesterase family protein
MINKPYKFSTNNYNEILFTSDQHYGHDPKWEIPIWKTRGFKNVGDHDLWLESEYSKVTKNSVIFSLGDPALNNTPQKLMTLLNKTSAPILHIWGNHFSCDYYIYKLAVKNYLFDQGLNLTEEELDMEKSLSYEIYPFTISRYFRDNNKNTPLKRPIQLIDGIPGMSLLNNHLIFLGSQCDITVDKTLIHLSHMAPKLWTRRAVAIFGHSHSELKGAQPSDIEQKVLDCGIENSIKYNGRAFFSFFDIKDIMSKKQDNTYDTHS